MNNDNFLFPPVKYVIPPFRYIEGTCVTNKELISVQSKQINIWRKKKLFNNEHLEVLLLIADYIYLSRLQIDWFLNRYDSTINVSSIIKDLCKMGLLARQYLDYTKNKDDSILELSNNDCFDDDVLDLKLSQKRSINFYSLTESAAGYLNENYKKDIKVCNAMDSETILGYLSANQFLSKYALLSRRKRDILSHRTYYSPVLKKTLKIDAFIKTLNIECIFLSVRRVPMWEEKIKERFSILGDYIVELYGHDNIKRMPIIVLMCQEDMHVADTYCVLKSSNLLNFDVLFTTDARTYNDFFHENLLKVRSEGEDTVLEEIPSPLLSVVGSKQSIFSTIKI